MMHLDSIADVCYNFVPSKKLVHSCLAMTSQKSKCTITDQRSQTFFSYEAFRLACLSPHCLFDGDISTIAQAPLATEGRPSGKQPQANQSITSPLCPQQQTADS